MGKIKAVEQRQLRGKPPAVKTETAETLRGSRAEIIWDGGAWVRSNPDVRRPELATALPLGSTVC